MVQIRVRNLNGRSAFARQIANDGADHLRPQLSILEQMIKDEVRAELVNRGVNLNREDSGKNGARLDGSFETDVKMQGEGFPLSVTLSSNAAHANILDKHRGGHTIRPRNPSGWLRLPASRTRDQKTIFARSVEWSPARDLSGYARVGVERATRAFLRRFS